MKRINLIKILPVVVAMFVAMGAFGQANTGQWAANPTVGDYVQSGAAAWNAPDGPDFGHKLTIGQPMPFWAWPSAIYNPDFDFSAIGAYATQANIENNVISSFEWKVGAYNTDNATTELDFDGYAAVAGYAANYVELTWTLADLGYATLDDIPVGGNEQLIQVVETPATATCPAVDVWFGVTIIDQPMVKFTDAGATEVGVDNVIAYGCEGSADVAVAATAIGITLDNTDENAIGATEDTRYHVVVDYKVYNCPVDGGTGDLVWASAVEEAAPTITQFGQDGATAITTANPVFAETTTLFAGEDYIIENVQATVYEYTLTSWNAGISRKSDYINMRDNGYTYAANLDQFTYYTRNSDAAATLVNRIVVLPTPVTGPIYHIPDDFTGF